MWVSKKRIEDLEKQVDALQKRYEGLKSNILYYDDWPGKERDEALMRKSLKEARRKHPFSTIVETPWYNPPDVFVPDVVRAILDHLGLKLVKTAGQPATPDRLELQKKQ